MKPVILLFGVLAALAACSDNAFIASVQSGTSAAPASVSALLGTTTLLVGQQVQATAKAHDAAGKEIPVNGSAVVWTTSRAAVAIVSSAGIVTAIAPGSASISATSQGVTGIADIVVLSAAPVASVQVTLGATSLSIGAQANATAALKDAAGNPTTGTVTWSSSNPTVATISSRGLVTSLASGTTDIVASSGAFADSARLTVTSSRVSVVFSDSFESGDFSKSENNVSWTSIVWADVSSQIAHFGTRAARLRQGDSSNWSELRFGGLPHMTEAFIQFYLYWPNGSESPSLGPKVKSLGPMNDKVFMLWGDKDSDYNHYSTLDSTKLAGCKVGAEMRGDGTGSDARVYATYMYSGDPVAQWGEGQGVGAQPPAPFMIDANRGRWVRIRIHAKVASAANNDGVVQIWADDNLVISNVNLQNYPRIYDPSAPNSYTNGYLFGWANNGYQPGQYTYVDDVVITSGGFPAS